MSDTVPEWLTINRGNAPLLLAIPHGGSEIPGEIEGRFVSPWLARKDADWWVPELYDFAREKGATIVRTAISRSVIDCNRDPSGASLYPGQATTGLCPVSTFDGEPLYREGLEPDAAEIENRRERWFTPYHADIASELQRLRKAHGTVVLYDAHSIRSAVPRLFDGELPQFNLGTNAGTTCAPELRDELAHICAQSGLPHVTDGRFRGGWTTRHYGQPDSGIHAVQMELAQRGYLTEPAAPDESNWPAPYDAEQAQQILPTLERMLDACLNFARR